MSRGTVSTMTREDGLVAARAASLKKRKGKAPAKATLERRAREARKKAAGNVAVENVAAEDGERKGFAAEVGVKDWSQQKSARQARTSGSVKKMDPSLEDLAARAEVVQTREPWENALALMRQRTGGWVHARVVSGRMLILLAQRFRVRGGEVQVLEGDEPVVPDGGGPGVLDGSELGAWVKTAELAWGYDEKEKEDAEEEEEEEEGSTRKRRRLRQKGRVGSSFTKRTVNELLTLQPAPSQLQLIHLIWVQCRAHLLL